MDEHRAPRVNSARLPDYIGQTVRLTCKVLRLQGESAMVETPDGGQVEVKLLRDCNMQDTFIEVVGRVDGPATVKMLGCVNMGSDLDMKLVNDCVELTHDPRFESLF